MHILLKYTYKGGYMNTYSYYNEESDIELYYTTRSRMWYGLCYVVGLAFGFIIYEPVTLFFSEVSRPRGRQVSSVVVQPSGFDLPHDVDMLWPIRFPWRRCPLDLHTWGWSRRRRARPGPGSR